MARKAVITGVADTAVGKLDLARAASGGRDAKMTWCRLADAEPGLTDAYDVVAANQEGEPVITGTLTFENMQTG